MLFYFVNVLLFKLVRNSQLSDIYEIYNYSQESESLYKDLYELYLAHAIFVLFEDLTFL